jgi:hypothetical protein
VHYFFVIRTEKLEAVLLLGQVLQLVLQQVPEQEQVQVQVPEQVQEPLAKRTD